MVVLRGVTAFQQDLSWTLERCGNMARGLLVKTAVSYALDWAVILCVVSSGQCWQDLEY